MLVIRVSHFTTPEKFDIAASTFTMPAVISICAAGGQGLAMVLERE